MQISFLFTTFADKKIIKMKQYKIYTKGNYIVIVDVQKNKYFYGIRKEVHIDKSNVNKAIYKAFNVKDFSSSIILAVPNILKENGDAYSEAEFDTFYQENTGNFNIPSNPSGESSDTNISSTALNAGQTFTGIFELNTYPDAMVTFETDQKGIVYFDFSPNGVNIDSTISVNYDPSLINPPQILVKGNRYFRVRFYNNSSFNQTYLRLNTYFGSFEKLTSDLNSIVPQTFGASVVRPIDFNLMVAKNLYQGHEVIIKDGINPDVDTGTVPEDIFILGGAYRGFPATPEEGQIVVAGADTGIVYYSYLASDLDENYTFSSKAVAGAGNYNLGHNVWRCNYMYFVGSSGNINVSQITLRQAVTTANVFVGIGTGLGQTFSAAYTVPKGHTAYIDRIQGTLRGGTSASADMYFWWRRNGQSPLLRLPFTLNFGSFYFDDVDYLVEIPELTDIMPRCVLCTANNVSVHVSYRILKVKN